MASSAVPSLRRRMVAAVVLFVACLGAFLLLLAVIFGSIVPDLVAWWGERFELQSQEGVATVAVIAGVTLWMGVGTVRHFHASPLAATNAQDAPEDEYPDLHAAVDRLAGEADVPKPDLKVLPTQLPNAFAVGLTQHTSEVVVTTGLLEALDDAERDAVLAHELAHVRNRDAAVMTVGYLLPAVAFAFAKALTSPLGSGDRPPWSRDPDADRPDAREGAAGAVGQTGGTWTSGVDLFGSDDGRYGYPGGATADGDGGGDGGGGGGGAPNPMQVLLAILVVVAIVVLTTVLTFAVSTLFWLSASLLLVLLARPREYAADATAVELTDDPDALASALETLDEALAAAPARHVRQVDGAVEPLYVMPLRRGLHGLGDVLLLSDDLFPRTHPDTDARVERIRGSTAES